MRMSYKLEDPERAMSVIKPKTVLSKVIAW